MTNHGVSLTRCNESSGSSADVFFDDDHEFLWNGNLASISFGGTDFCRVSRPDCAAINTSTMNIENAPASVGKRAVFDV